MDNYFNTTAVMQYGYRIIDDLVLGLQRYMASRGIPHLSDLVGEMLPSFVQPSELDRQTIVYPKIDHQKCVGCGRCEISCNDGGHQAIVFDKTTRQPRILGKKCPFMCPKLTRFLRFTEKYLVERKIISIFAEK